MPKFQFRLASVLRFREQKKEEKQWQLRALHEVRAEIENRLLELEGSLRAGRENMALEADRVLTALEFLEIKLAADHAEHVTQRIHQERDRLASIEQKVKQTRDELIEANRSLKSMELLQNRLREKFHYAQNADEQKKGDEIAQRKFALARRKNIPG